MIRMRGEGGQAEEKNEGFFLLHMRHEQINFDGNCFMLLSATNEREYEKRRTTNAKYEGKTKD